MDNVVYDGENSLEVQKFLNLKGCKNVNIERVATFGLPYRISITWMDNATYQKVGLKMNPGDLMFVNDDGEIETVEHPRDE